MFRGSVDGLPMHEVSVSWTCAQVEVRTMTDRCPCPRCQSDRLGDYYAGLTEYEWGKLTWDGNLYGKTVAVVAYSLFRESYVNRLFSLSSKLVALTGDAFASGALKYGKVGDWRNVPLDHHMQSAGGHFDAWLKDHASLDAESGLTHEAHFLARAVMIQEIRRTNGK